MRYPCIMLATLALNEIEWLPFLVDQHKNWPGLMGWCFVEAADKVYADTNPDMVSSSGLSTDGTTEFLSRLNLRAPLLHIRKGMVGNVDPAQGKCEARNEYLRVADTWKPDWIIVLDADEFYTSYHQERISNLLYNAAKVPVLLRQRYPWFPPAELDKLWAPFSREVTGAYWGIPHLRIFPYYEGMMYNNHNHPDVPGTEPHWLRKQMVRLDGDTHAPQCVHMAFASRLSSRTAKHRYYEARGEGKGDGRTMYVECRRAWETYTGGDLPHGARVSPYDGPVPEVFL